MNEEKTPGRKGRSRTILLAALAGIVAGVAGVYVMGSGERNAAKTAQCSADEALLSAMRPMARGEVAGVMVPDAPEAMPNLAFLDADNQPKSLADFRDKVLLINLWATWCAPCREEMPELDALQREFDGSDFEVVAISIDTQNPEAARDFYKELGIASMAFYADPKAGVFQDLKRIGRAVGLPTTLILDKSGCQIGYLPGPAMWASDDARGLIRAALGRS